jgi:hypothetical protein
MRYLGVNTCEAERAIGLNPRCLSVAMDREPLKRRPRWIEALGDALGVPADNLLCTHPLDPSVDDIREAALRKAAADRLAERARYLQEKFTLPAA